MTDTTYKKNIAFMQKIFGSSIDDDLYIAYWNMFKMRSDEEFTKMCENVIKTFIPTAQVPFPTPAHFLSASNAAGGNRARAAIMAVTKAVGRVGPYKSVSFGDPSLHAVIERFGGWVEICNWDQEQWQFNEKNFIAAYQSAELDGYGPEYLMGLCELENSKKQLSGKQLEIANKMSQTIAFRWAGFDENSLLENKDKNNAELPDLTGLIENIGEKI